MSYKLIASVRRFLRHVRQPHNTILDLLLEAAEGQALDDVEGVARITDVVACIESIERAWPEVKKAMKAHSITVRDILVLKRAYAVGRQDQDAFILRLEQAYGKSLCD